jgi:hypothetical protein
MPSLRKFLLLHFGQLSITILFKLVTAQIH